MKKTRHEVHWMRRAKVDDENLDDNGVLHDGGTVRIPVMVADAAAVKVEDDVVVADEDYVTTLPNGTVIARDDLYAFASLAGRPVRATDSRPRAAPPMTRRCSTSRATSTLVARRRTPTPRTRSASPRRTGGLPRPRALRAGRRSPPGASTSAGSPSGPREEPALARRRASRDGRAPAETTRRARRGGDGDLGPRMASASSRIGPLDRRRDEPTSDPLSPTTEPRVRRPTRVA